MFACRNRWQRTSLIIELHLKRGYYFAIKFYILTSTMGKNYGHKNRKFRHTKTPYSKSDRKKQTEIQQDKKVGSRQTFAPKVNLREDQVGITEFISDCAGFTGILKSRFSDFHVNEIDSSGIVLKLTDLNIPREHEETLSDTEKLEARNEIIGIIDAATWQEIEKLVSDTSKERYDKMIDFEATHLNKEERTKIHSVLKKLYKNKLSTTTISQQQQEDSTNQKLAKDCQSQQPQNNEAHTLSDKKFIRITQLKGGRDMKRRSWNFPGEYVHFLVHKENMDTGEVTICIANSLGFRPSLVNYCGTKDKRAKTTQKFCIRRRTPVEIVRSIKNLRNVHIGNFEFSKKVLKLGDLQGNYFRIALRHITQEPKEIEAALETLRKRGFINYFGLQRFGNCATIPTYEIGIALLKSDFKKACELILKPRENDIDFMREIRAKWWENRNSAAAAAMFRNDKFIEKKLLDGLARYGENNYSDALQRIPRNMLLLYPHAYQSLIFNRIASRRIKEFGLKLIPGDLVYCNKDAADENNLLDAVEEQESLKFVDEAVAGDDEEIENLEQESIFKSKVKPLTATDIESGNYSVFDIVLPLPGYDITYPNNEIATWYEQILQEDGLSSAQLRHKVKTFALGGAYRKLLVQPSDLIWHFRKYKTNECPLIASDWELLKNQELPSEPTGEEAKFTALILEFSLPTAVYATMLLRELLKTDTSAANHVQMELDELRKVINNDKKQDDQKETNEMMIDQNTEESDENIDNAKKS